MKERPRRCLVCGYSWHALRHGAVGGRWRRALFTFARSRSRAVAKTPARLYESWGQCPNCGSESVETVKDKDFVPDEVTLGGPPGAWFPPEGLDTDPDVPR